MNNIVEAENVIYSIKDKNILNGVSLNVGQGAILGIAGESGSGKTTLGKIIAGIIKPNSGLIKLNVSKSNKYPAQFLFQNTGEIINPFRTVSSMVTEVIKLRLKNNADKTVLAASELKKIMNSLDIKEELWNRRGFQLSGGEQQRVALARILSSSPEIIILDEPFSAQDPDSSIRLIDIFKRINTERNITLICISHNLRLLREFCTDYLILKNGQEQDSGNMSGVDHSLNHYTQFLLSAESYLLTLKDF